MSQPVTRISINALTLARGDRVLAADLSVEVQAGSVVELVGPNGSGKTTLLRAIAGFFHPQAGAIAFEGPSGPLDDPQASLHALGHRDGLKGPLTVGEHVSFWAHLLGGDPARAPAALERLGLTRLERLPARVLSQGQARRLALTRLLAVPRPVWLLDEPAAGLDAAGKALLADLIEAHRQTGGIILAATHERLGPPCTLLEMGQGAIRC